MLTLLEEPWFFVPVDSISGMRSAVHRRELDETAVRDMLRRTRLGYHRVIAALASAGNHVIMDYPLSEPWRLSDLLQVLDGYDVTLVDVHCSADELARQLPGRLAAPEGVRAIEAMRRIARPDLLRHPGTRRDRPGLPQSQ